MLLVSVLPTIGAYALAFGIDFLGNYYSLDTSTFFINTRTFIH